MFYVASRDWLWDVLPLAIGFVLATLQRAWSSYQSHVSETWPITYGRVMNATAEEQGNTPLIRIVYNYRVGNESYAGNFKKVFSEGSEANSWEKALGGTEVPVRYDPNKPSRSRLSESDLRPMVRAAAPIIAEEPTAMPPWKRFLCQAGLVMAVLGFSICLAQVISAMFGKPLLNRSAEQMLTGGAIILPIVAFWGTYGAGKRTWRAVPGWMKYLGYVVIYSTFLYALLPRPSRPDQPESRHDVSYQLAGYFGAIEALYARLRSGDGDEYDLQRALSPETKIG